MEKRKKNYLLIALVILLAALIVLYGYVWRIITEKRDGGYDVSQLAPSYEKLAEHDSVYLTVAEEEYPYDSEFIEVVFNNDTDSLWMYGHMYKLETLIGGEWYKVSMRENHAFPLSGILLQPHSSGTSEVWLEAYQCRPGRHRIIEEIRKEDPDRDRGDDDGPPPVSERETVVTAVEFNLI